MWLKPLKSIEFPPHVPHVATHGFCLPASPQTLARPQFYSRLAMAGANKHLDLDDAKASFVGEDDGIPYSLEAQDPNPEGAELAALSACGTGKGAIDGSEDLAQALRIVGVKRILTTFWPAFDKETAIFMENFHRIWLSHPDQDAAALDAVIEMFRQRDDPSYRRPLVLAPSVLIGG